jgi:anti-anti-sigma regulatory factor
MFYQNELTMRNTTDMTGGKPIAVQLQSISGWSAVYPLVAFYDIHGRKGAVLFFCSVSVTIRDITIMCEMNELIYI